MQTLQHWSETSAFFIWLRESPSIWAYPAVFFAHTIGLIFSVGASVVVSARTIAAARAPLVAPLAKFFPAIWIGVALTVLSGGVMLGADPETKLSNPLFPAKMLLAAAAVVLMIVLRRQLAATELSASVRPSTRVVAAALLVCWLGIVAAGKFMAYF